MLGKFQLIHYMALIKMFKNLQVVLTDSGYYTVDGLLGNQALEIAGSNGGVSITHTI